MDVRSKAYLYHTTVVWTEHRKGTMSCEGKPNVEVATPLEFKGHEGIWSTEDLFVASVNSCVMNTFLAFAEQEGLAFIAYESLLPQTRQLVPQRAMRGKSQFLEPSRQFCRHGDIHITFEQHFSQFPVPLRERD